MNRELLEKPFEPDEIKQRQGNFGKILDYIEAYAVIQRLNDAFDAEWSFRILAHKVFRQEDEVLVMGELKAADIVKTQFGSSKITRAKETGEIISLADDLKAAATDALKKSATLLGIRLQLYSGSNSKTTNQPHKTRVKCEIGFEPVEGTANVYKPKFTATRGEETASPPNDKGNGKKQMSVKQFSYIQSFGRKLGYDLNALSQKSIEMFNRELANLTVAEASTFIDHMHAGFHKNTTAL